MIVATLIGNPTWAVIAALATPLSFIILFILLSKDPGPRRHVDPGHPAYVGRPEDGSVFGISET